MKRGVLIFVGIFLAIIVGGIVYAAVPNPGHSKENIEPCGANQILKMNIGGTAWTCGTDEAGSGSSVWQQSGTNIYYNNGNVGIGIASPSEKLTVVGNIKIPWVSEDRSIGYVYGDGSLYSQGIRFKGTQRALEIYSNTGDETGGDIILSPDSSVGNVGIGTSSPTALLHVSRYISSGQPQTIAIFGQKTSSTMERGLEIMGGDSNGGFYGIKAHGTDASFFIANQAGTKNLILTEAGNAKVRGAITLNDSGGFYFVTAQHGITCNTACANSDVSYGFDSDSGSCLKAWFPDGSPPGDSCAEINTQRKCLCAGVISF
jgi:hypothetical protein